VNPLLPQTGEPPAAGPAENVPAPGTRYAAVEDATWNLYTGANWSVASSALLRGIVHEIGNPLQAVVLSASGLAAAAQMPEHRLTGAIERETARLSQLLADLRLLVQRPEQPPAAVPVDGLLREVAELQRHQKCEIDITLSVAITVGVPAVFGSAERLRHTMVNLVANARESLLTVGGGQIRLSAGLERSHVVLAVEDDGPGIREDEREWVFEPFATTRVPSEGRGLGLTVARHIVTRHGGTLVAEAPQNGRGARLVARLPQLRR